MKRVLEPEDAGRLVAILDETGSRSVAEDKARELVDGGLAAVSEAGPVAGGDDIAQRTGAMGAGRKLGSGFPLHGNDR